MSSAQKIIQAAAGNAAGEALYVEDVFSTYLYEGGSTLTASNGVDLLGEGGLVWIKNRSLSVSHSLYDTARGAGQELVTNSSAAEVGQGGYGASFLSDGFKISFAGDDNTNQSGSDYASWTFRKAPKFFDVVTYTGNGVAGREIAHNLDGPVGMILVKRTDGTRDWWAYHRNDGTNQKLGNFNSSSALVAGIANVFGDDSSAIFPSDSVFTVGSSAATNYNGWEYVAYLFAHNNGDGEFGEDADQDIIKCGSFTTTGDTFINLGFEPQWVLYKRTDAADDWNILDNMRGFLTGGADTYLRPNSSNAEGATNFGQIESTGFRSEEGSGKSYIYIAIRRGPMKTPESGTEVFAVTAQNTASPSIFNVGFPADMTWHTLRPYAQDKYLGARLTNKTLEPADNGIEAGSYVEYDYAQNSVPISAYSAGYPLHAVAFRRSPGFFDVVCYEGNQTNRTINHNLGVAPEMMWVKNRADYQDWAVYHHSLGATRYIKLNTNGVPFTDSTVWNNTDPTASNFTVGTSQLSNDSAKKVISYLFASVPGVSKVGSYVGTTTTKTIDCGFTNGARFVLIKCVDVFGSWFFWDSERGIVSGNDPYLTLDASASEVTSTDYIDPHPTGFSLPVNGETNQNTNNYIFLAIA